MQNIILATRKITITKLIPESTETTITHTRKLQTRFELHSFLQTRTATLREQSLRREGLTNRYAVRSSWSLPPHSALTSTMSTITTPASTQRTSCGKRNLFQQVCRSKKPDQRSRRHDRNACKRVTFIQNFKPNILVSFEAKSREIQHIFQGCFIGYFSVL